MNTANNHLADQFREYRMRLEDLMQEHGIDIDRPGAWQLLAAVLIQQTAYGRQVWDDEKYRWVDPADATKGQPGRTTLWTLERSRALVNDMASFLEVSQGNIEGAAQLMLKSQSKSEWLKYGANTLAARYSEALKQIEAEEARENVSRIARELVASMATKNQRT